MDTNLIISLDELINFVLTDKYLTYNREDIDRIELLMKEKLANIQDEYEREFYEGVIDGLIMEMKEACAKDIETNPIKPEYDNIGEVVCNNIRSFNKGGLCSQYYPSYSDGVIYIRKHPSFTNRDLENIANSIGVTFTKSDGTQIILPNYDISNMNYSKNSDNSLGNLLKIN